MPNLEIKRRLAAPVSRVFQAWSDPEVMREWFFAGNMTSEVSNEFRVGGTYRVAMIDGEKDGPYIHTGVYKTIEPNQKIVFTWNSHVAEDTLVTLTFAAEGEETLMTLHHELFANDEQVAMHNQGWTSCLDHLEAFIARSKAMT